MKINGLVILKGLLFFLRAGVLGMLQDRVFLPIRNFWSSRLLRKKSFFG